MRRRSGTSTAASGSSSRSTDGPDISARPTATRWRSPPDRSVTRRSSSRSISSIATTRSRSGDVARMPAVEEVAPDVHVREQRDVLRHVADVALVRRHVDPALRREQHAAVDGDRSAVRRAQPRDGVEDRRLAGARRPEERGRARLELHVRRRARRPCAARCPGRSRRAACRRGDSPIHSATNAIATETSSSASASRVLRPVSA